jgi:hypothetical protein
MQVGRLRRREGKLDHCLHACLDDQVRLRLTTPSKQKMYTLKILGYYPDLPIAVRRLRRRLDQECSTEVWA